MAQKVECWKASDGTVHPSYIAAVHIDFKHAVLEAIATLADIPEDQRRRFAELLANNKDFRLKLIDILEKLETDLEANPY